MRLTNLLPVFVFVLSGCGGMPSSRSRALPEEQSLINLQSDGAYVGPLVTIEEIERKLEEEGQDVALDQEWLAFKAKIRPGDQLRIYDHPRGGAGYVLLRNNSPIAHFFTIIY